LDKKQRLYRLIESYINDSKGNAVQKVYGKGTEIKIHNINFGVTSKYVLIEAVIILGDTINEQTIDKELANILIQDASVYFFSDYIIKTLIRFDV
jgi:hypothetical protein